MITITRKAAELLRDKLAQLYMEAAGLDMIDIDPEVAKRLKGKLVESCFKTGIGFRMLAAGDEWVGKTFHIKLDRAQEGDEVIEAEGVKVFVDPASAAEAADHELDYIDEPKDNFVLR